MNDKKYEIKKIYFFLKGIKNTMNETDRIIKRNVINQYNMYMDQLSDLLDETFDFYKISDYEGFGDNTFDPRLCRYQINQVIEYIENMHINSSEYQINKVGYLYNSIDDKELRDRCGDILLGEGPYDRAINQATQILENRIKIKAELTESPLIGLPLVSKVIHSKIEETILKMSDKPDIQEGYAFLFKGVISNYRNPTHHSFSFDCDRESALKICAYIDELLKVVEQSEKVK